MACSFFFLFEVIFSSSFFKKMQKEFALHFIEQKEIRGITSREE
jgi:hypothetical protein